MKQPSNAWAGRSTGSVKLDWSANDSRALAAVNQSPTSETLTTSLLAWQSTGDPCSLERLVASARPLIERIARALLRSHGVVDPAAVDETVSLVLDHLRRLPGGLTQERLVAPFAPRVPDGSAEHVTDAGRAYLLWLSRERARDVARARRRHGRRAIPFSLLDKPTITRVHGVADTRPGDGGRQPSADLHDRLVAVIPRLPARERMVVELLLSGKNQAFVARTLSVCEGTVSRLRIRAVASLRRLLDE